ncbi:hypothetical protein M885DRAFT_519333 [Pelagophyceae sp. CCMP2097]|nr:hypothetical protein M885DRAFT_519333 [Pelagophyceae sp. CCMP2097]
MPFAMMASSRVKGKPVPQYRMPLKSAFSGMAAVGALLVAACSYDQIVAENFFERRSKFITRLWPSDAANAQTARALRAYVASKRAQVVSQRGGFALWDYWDLRQKLRDAVVPKRGFTWADVVVLRMELFSAKLTATGDMRYRIEKDKCEMLRMLGQLSLPHPRVRFTWDEDAYDEQKLKAYLMTADYPAMLKVGHMHQQKSTLFLPDAESVHKTADDLVAWTTSKMKSKLLDGNSVWAHATNPLYAELEPCLILQDVANPAAFVSGAGGNDLRPLEMMVEVLWGVPHNGVLVTDVAGAMLLGEPQHVDTIEYLVRTDGWVAYKWPKVVRTGGWLASKWYLNQHSAVRTHRKDQETWFRAIDPAVEDGKGIEETCAELSSPFERRACGYEYRREQSRFWAKYGDLPKHLGKVWDTCAQMGRGVGADYVRCDVFIDTHSGQVLVNEISLSSYWGNTLSIAWQRDAVDLWAGGFGRTETTCEPEATCGDAFSSIFTGELPAPGYVYHAP